MNPFKFVTAPSVGTRIDHTLQWLTESPLALPGKYVVSLIVSHYSDRLLALVLGVGLSQSGGVRWVHDTFKKTDSGNNGHFIQQ